MVGNGNPELIILGVVLGVVFGSYQDLIILERIGMKCEVCGAVDRVQKHHILYQPEFIQQLCVDCHLQAHNRVHGVGCCVGEFSKIKLSECRENFIRDWKRILPGGLSLNNRELAEKYHVTRITISSWAWKLGLRGACHVKGKKCVEKSAEKAE